MKGMTLLHQATPEQKDAVDRFLRGESLKLVAVAGSGKTTTLRLMAEGDPRRRLMYLAFNRSVKEEGRRKMPRNVEVLTLHGLAYREVVKLDPDLRSKLAAGGGQVRAFHVWEALGLENRVAAYVVKATLEAFLRSNLDRPTAAMVPLRFRQLAERRRRRKEVEEAVQAAGALWERMRDPKDPFPLSHDGYVKIWAQSNPRIGGVDALLVDEAQDLDPVFAGVLERQRWLQRVYVGDPNQEIYGWRGAVNALKDLDAPESHLTWSFRFGEGLASRVRRLMALMGREVRLWGKASWETEVGGDLEVPYTVLCRTNAGVVDALVRLRPRKAYVLGGIEELLWLLADAEALREEAPREKPHPDLLLLETWDDLRLLAEEVGDPTAMVLMSLAQDYPDFRSLAQYLASVVVPKEGEAEVVFSTAHKAKGREWPRILLWEDYPKVWDPAFRKRWLEQLGPEGQYALWQEENLLYVAATRAMRHLVAFLPLPWDGGGSEGRKEEAALQLSGKDLPLPTEPPSPESLSPEEALRLLREVEADPYLPLPLREKLRRALEALRAVPG